MVHGYEDACQSLQRLGGLRVLEDTSLAEPEVGRRGGMAWIGDNSLEFGEPFGPQSPVTGFLNRFGPGMHSLGVQVTNLDATLAHLLTLKVDVVARSEEFAFVFCDPRDTEGLLLQFASTEMPFDPRFGGAVPELAITPLLDVSALAYVGATVPDPGGSATRLAEVIGTAVTFSAGGVTAGVDLGDCTLGLTKGGKGERSRWTHLGLLVPDLQAAETLLHDDGWEPRLQIGLDGRGELAIAPERTGMIPVTLVDALLPGDPRLG